MAGSREGAERSGRSPPPAPPPLPALPGLRAPRPAPRPLPVAARGALDRGRLADGRRLVRCRSLCHPAGLPCASRGPRVREESRSPCRLLRGILRAPSHVQPRAPDLAKQNLSSGCAPVLSQGLQRRAAEKRVCTRVPHTQGTRALRSTASPLRGPCSSQPIWARGDEDNGCRKRPRL